MSSLEQFPTPWSLLHYSLILGHQELRSQGLFLGGLKVWEGEELMMAETKAGSSADGT